MELIVLTIGLLSNAVGFFTLVLSKKLRSIATKNMHTVLFAIDSNSDLY